MKPTTLYGLKALRRCLEEARGTLGTAPILLIEGCASAQPASARTIAPKPAGACQHVNFLLSRELGYRTVAVSSSPAVGASAALSTIPLASQVNEWSDLMSRVGATSIVAVGSGATMDVAKALLLRRQQQSASTSNARGRTSNPVEELILVPSTYGAAMVAASAHSLLYDPLEEAIEVASFSKSSSPSLSSSMTTTTVATLEPKFMVQHHPQTAEEIAETSVYSSTKNDAAWAAVALVLDAVLQGRPASELVMDGWEHSTTTATPLLKCLLDCLCVKPQQSDKDNNSINNDTDLQHQLLLQALLTTGSSALSYGINVQTRETRSIPLAVATSLWPEHFSQYNLLTIMASLAPALYRILLETSNDNDDDKHSTSKRALLRQLLSDSNDDSSSVDGSLNLLESLLESSSSSSPSSLYFPPPPRLVTNESMESLVSSIRSNQILWNSLDAPESRLRQVLRDHVLVE